MTPVAVVFPGQGSQQPRMGVAWQDQPSSARWSEADDVLGWDVIRLGLHAEADALRLVDVRARATQAAAEAMPGTMVAALGLDVEEVTDVSWVRARC